MGPVRVAAATGFAVVLALAALSAGPGGGVAAGPFLVGYSGPGALTAALRTGHAQLVRRLGPLHVAEVRANDPAAMRRLPGIRFVVRPTARFSADAPPGPITTAAAGSALQWQYAATGEAGVPDTVLRAAAAIRIAVVDTGADLAAPDLAAKSPDTYNTRTGTSDVRDENGHGTFVASLAAGSVRNGDGFTGAGGDAQLLVVKSGSPSGAFTDMDEAAGIIYAVDHGARIINLSVGGPSTSSVERRAISYAVFCLKKKMAAVGNEHEFGDPVEYPAALLQPVGSAGVGGGGLAVAASTASGGRASFSNTGSWVSLAAPGENVLGDLSELSSPLVYPRTLLPGSPSGLYGFASGTSFAAPQVAGAAALVWAANPSLDAQQVAAILKETASGAGRWTPELGFGVIDVAAAVAHAQAGTRGILLSGTRSGSRVHLTWGGDGSAYTIMVSVDGQTPRPVLSRTSLTTTWVTVPRGHTYSFTVAALDGVGAVVSTSAVLTVMR